MPKSYLSVFDTCRAYVKMKFATKQCVCLRLVVVVVAAVGPSVLYVFAFFILLWLTEILRWPPLHPVRTHWNLDGRLNTYSPLQHRWTPNITVRETAPCEKRSKSAAARSGGGNGGRLLPCHSTSDRQNPNGLSLSALNGKISYKQSRHIHKHTHTHKIPPLATVYTHKQTTSAKMLRQSRDWNTMN